MDKKILAGILVILIVLTAWMFVRFVIGGPEDNWICVEGEWVKHGNPSAEKPAEVCPGQKNTVVESPEADQVIGRNYEVYFSNNNLDPEITCVKVFPVIKPVGNDELSLEKILEVLLQGPGEKDKEAGYFTSIPENIKIKSVKKEGNTAKIDFSRDIEKGVGGSCRVTAIRAQIYWTVINFDKAIRSVIISVDGDVNALQP